MTEEQVLARGASARALLSNPDLLSFHTEWKAIILEAISNTQPAQTAERERLCFQHQGVVDFLGIMQSYVDAAQAIYDRQHEEITD